MSLDDQGVASFLTDVLIVEDDPTQAEELACYLRRARLKVEATVSGSLAIHTIAQLRPKVALIDYNLPDLDGVTVADALSYRKIFDTTNARMMLSDADMMSLGARIRAYMKVSKLGPLAIVAVTERAYRQARLFEVLAEGDRPIRIFRELHLAREWLDSFDTDS